MKNRFDAKTSILSLLISVLIAVPVFAEQNSSQQQGNKNQNVKRTSTVKERVYKKLQEAQELADQSAFTKASKVLAEAKSGKVNEYEKALIEQMYAYVYFGQENYNKAATAYQNITQLKDGVPEAITQEAYYNLAKMRMLQERYAESLKALNTWFAKVSNPSSEAYILRAQLYYQLEKYKKALPDIQKAIAKHKQSGKTPKENWLLLERAIYYQNEDYRGMAKSLKALVQYYSKPEYWLQLSAVYNELGQSNKELATLEAAYEQNMLVKQSSYIALAQSFLAKEIPYKAAKVLLDGMQKEKVEQSAKNLSLLGDALMMAREYEQAVDVMAKAAKASGLSKDYYKLAQIYAQRQQYSQSLKFIDKSLTAKDPIKPEKSYMLRGLVLFHLKRLDESQQQFKKLAKISGQEKKAQQWISFLDSEKAHQAYVKQY